MEKEMNFKFEKPRMIYNERDGTYRKFDEKDSDYSQYENKSRITYFNSKSTKKKLKEIRKKHGIPTPTPQ